MFTLPEIDKIIREYAASPSGKTEIKEKYGIDYDPKNDKSVQLSEMKKYGEKMKEILYRHITPVIKTLSIDDIVVGEPTKTVGNEYEIILSLQNVERESLDPERYPEGVSDIVLHFSRGWSARGSVEGEWKPYGDVVWSRKSRKPNSYIRDAVNEFNQNSKEIATAELVGDYQ